MLRTSHSTPAALNALQVSVLSGSADDHNRALQNLKGDLAQQTSKVQALEGASAEGSSGAGQLSDRLAALETSSSSVKAEVADLKQKVAGLARFERSSLPCVVCVCLLAHCHRRPIAGGCLATVPACKL